LVGNGFWVSNQRSLKTKELGINSQFFQQICDIYKPHPNLPQAFAITLGQNNLRDIQQPQNNLEIPKLLIIR